MAQNQLPIRHPNAAIRADGWRIPGRDTMSTIAKVENIKLNDVAVKGFLLTSSDEQEPIVTVELYSLDSNGNLKIRSELCGVRALSVYEVNEQRFAYIVGFVPIEIASNGVRISQGTAFTLYYYDEDGNGSFETRTGSGSLRLPEWATAKGRRGQ